MTATAIVFWACALLVVYTYVGYGALLAVLVKLREAVCPAAKHAAPAEAPEVTLLIAAYNEQEIVAAKMENCRALVYPEGRLHIAWVTDGSTDRTPELLAAYPGVTVLHDARRGGKTAALNRALEHIHTPIVVFTDANTMLNPEAVTEIVRRFDDPQVGCVAGEKRVAAAEGSGAAATEGVYWKYESKLKEWDCRLHSAVGAAGELFAVRRDLWRTMPEDTLLDDFVCSMLIAADGYRIAYCKEACALETPSADMGEEGKRKRRIAAGGLQSVRLAPRAAVDRHPRGARGPGAPQRGAALVRTSGTLRRAARPAGGLLPRGGRRMGARTPRKPRRHALGSLLFPLHEPQRLPRSLVSGDPPGPRDVGKGPPRMIFCTSPIFLLDLLVINC